VTRPEESARADTVAKLLTPAQLEVAQQRGFVRPIETFTGQTRWVVVKPFRISVLGELVETP
jgi:hypothetical protein